ncbi:TPA: amidohydrolase family protein [Yersinia enterocolitica]
MGVKRLAIIDETRIDTQVLSLTTSGLNNIGKASVELAIRANNLMAQAVINNPTRFQFLAALPFTKSDVGANELYRAAVKQGAKGGILFGRVGDRHLDDCLFEEIFACAAHLHVPLLIHLQIPHAEVRGAYYSGFTPEVDLVLSTFSLGWHYEAGMDFVRMVLGGVFDRYPNLQIILGHWGEVVIFYLERLTMLDRVSKLEKPFLEYVRNNLYLIASGMFSHDYLQRAIATVGR